MKYVENMEYNTTRNHLIIREYGRHIQKMAEYTLTLEDEEDRRKNAYAIIELMALLNPHVKSVEDYKHKLWDHLHIITDFQLEVDSPYPKPTREKVEARPERMSYPKRYPKYSHLGKNIEIVIDKALNEEDEEKRKGLANSIAYYMKLTYSNWHKELVHDDNIQTELSAITDGELEFTTRPFIKHRVDGSREEFVSNIGKHRKNYGGRNGGRSGQGGGGNRDGRDNRDGRSNRKFGKKRY